MNNKKRLIGFIVGITMAATSMVGLSACKDKHEHSWEIEWTQSATEHWHEPECDDTTEVKDKGAHVWDNGTVVTEATHTKPGQKKYTCETCGYEKTEVIPATGHTYKDKLGYDDDFHWKEPSCDCENLTEAELKKDKSEHVLVPVVDEQPTDTKNGKQHYECSTEGCDYETEQETLYKYIGEAISGGDKVTVGNVEDDKTVIAAQGMNSNAWTGGVKITKLNEASKAYIYDLHVSMKGLEAWGVPMTQQRIGIQITENTGFYFWVRDRHDQNIGDRITIRKFTADNKTNAMAECQEEVVVVGSNKETEYGWISAAILGEGADLRIVRANNKLSLYAAKDGVYEYIGNVTCGDEANSFAVYGVETEITFSDFALTALTHVEGKAPTATEAGWFEYYYTGADENKVYYDASGKLTAWDALVRPAVLESVEITLKTHKDGAETAFTGTAVKVDGADVTVTGGKITLENVEPNTEITITADGYNGTLKITKATETAVLEYEYATATGKVDLSYMNDADHKIVINEQYSTSEWAGSAVINGLKETGKAFTYDLHISGTDHNEWWQAAYQRIGIQVTENTGFYLWVRTVNSSSAPDVKVTIRKFTAENKTNCTAESNEEALVVGDADEGTYGWISSAILSAEGADLRIVRVNNKLNLYVKNAEGYQYIGTVTCGEEANSFAVYGVTAQFTFSGFGVTALTHVDGKAPSATEAGWFEYYYTGADENKVYYDASGKLTAWDALVRPAVLESVEITLKTHKDGAETAFTGTAVKVDGADVTVTGGKITLENVEPNTEITITADGYNGTLKITKATETAVLEYEYATATGKVDLSHMNDENHAITVNGTGSDWSSQNWAGSAKLNVLEANTDNVTFEFTVKNVTNSDATNATDFNTWAAQRFAIQTAKGNRGFLFFEPKGECNIFDMTDESFGDNGKTRFGENGGTYAWLGERLRSDTGAQFKIVRAGNTLTLSAMNDSQWTEIGSIDCTDADNEIIIYASGVTYEFSDFKVTANS